VTDIPFNLDNVIYGKTVENARIEYKRNITDENRLSIGSTLCAFANDYLNLNGGWIIIGIDAPDGEPVLPPCGLEPNQVERVQQEIRVLGRTTDPPYHPAIFSIIFQDKNIVVAYAPSGEDRPYTSKDPRKPEKREYFIREGAETVKADKATKERLIQYCAKTPFDDRVNISAEISDIDTLLVRNFLVQTESGLAGKDIGLETYKSMRIVGPYHDSFKPKNISLMMFTGSPHEYFPGCYFEVVQFGDTQGGDIIEERKFTGLINRQISNVIEYLVSMTPRQIRKTRHQAEVDRFSAFPYEALEEAIVNAAYHRGYDSNYEPIKIYLYPDRMEIINYPGPVPGIELQDFEKDFPIPPVPLRNRRMGEFLKELRLAEMRSTGIPKIKKSMMENGSSKPQFLFDQSRTYFKVVLPAHPKYTVIHTLREAAYQWSIGEQTTAKKNLTAVFNKNPGSGAIAGQLIEYCFNSNEEESAKKVFEKYHGTTLKTEVDQPYLRYFRCLINSNNTTAASAVVNLIDERDYLNQPIEIAIAFKRVKELEKAHIILTRIYGQYDDDFTYLRNYAEVKISLSNELLYSRRSDWSTIKRLQREALDLLQRAIPLSPDDTSKGWCYFNLGRLKTWLSMPKQQIDEAFRLAIELVPGEKTFADRYKRFREHTFQTRTKPIGH